ncbi:MAG: LysR family transcriptional regulator ArgP [Spirochaetales bacterium]|nr:LysR family transcriptional regulator ArgP [Spirochaetales bacterium]
MFDYKLLEALAGVVDYKGFDKAAKVLFLTQSAVSQRVKLLEEQSGKVLITRQNPPSPTEAGKKLIGHYHQVKLLENEILADIQNEIKTSFSTIRIGINADSLATWFLPVLAPFLRKENIVVDLKVDDQDETKVLLKDGVVAGCISSSPSPVQGCSVSHIGKMEYLMVCTKNFFYKEFHNEFTMTGVMKTPAVLFNAKDNLHKRYLGNLFGEGNYQFPAHYVPSSEKFLEMIAMELAYGVLPLHQYENDREKYSLVEMTAMRLPVDLFWHRWNIHSRIFNELNRIILSGMRKI